MRPADELRQNTRERSTGQAEPHQFVWSQAKRYLEYRYIRMNTGQKDGGADLSGIRH